MCFFGFFPWSFLPFLFHHSLLALSSCVFRLFSRVRSFVRARAVLWFFRQSSYFVSVWLTVTDSAVIVASCTHSSSFFTSRCESHSFIDCHRMPFYHVPACCKYIIWFPFEKFDAQLLSTLIVFPNAVFYACSSNTSQIVVLAAVFGFAHCHCMVFQVHTSGT